ncbi:MAG TPA: SGNH/GDSL hydrolase family protein [Longimicrobiaceae bacterium]|nr:SGNH/GDSL hydrolase family protein [Longimicrobiaceae bacterium]
MEHEQSRRQFLATAVGGAVGLSLMAGVEVAAAQGERLKTGSIVLFQGDSITDFGRNRGYAGANDPGALGTGYPLLVASAALRDHPGDWLRFFNRGVSGNTVPDLQARWEEDTLAIEPDVLSILIGVNDIWHTLEGSFNGTVQSYERDYSALLDRTRRALPSTRLVVLEPFVLRTGAVDARWFPEFDERRAVARRVAQQAGATFIPLQEMFDELAEKAPPGYWLRDGVHPTPAGHAAIAERWRKVVDL